MVADVADDVNDDIGFGLFGLLICSFNEYDEADRVPPPILSDANNTLREPYILFVNLLLRSSELKKSLASLIVALVFSCFME